MRSLGSLASSMRMLRANLSHEIADIRCDSFNSEIFKYCCMVVDIPIKILIVPIAIGAYT